MTFLLGLTCYANGTVIRLAMCFWRKSYQKCWRKSCCQSRETCGSSRTWLWLTLHIRSKNIWPPLTVITGLDRVGQWLGLPGHQTSYQWTSSYGATLEPWFPHHQLILKSSYCPHCWGSSNLPFLSVHVSLCFVIVSCVLRSVAVHLNICSKLGQNTSITSNLTVHSTARTHLRYCSLTINLCFGPPYHLKKIGLEFFCTCRYLHFMEIVPFIVPKLISFLCQVPEPEK